jgi:DNA-binding NarL/FixJ family response regulator
MYRVQAKHGVTPVAEPTDIRSGRPIRVVVVEDHPLVRESLCSILTASGEFDVVGEAADGMTALDVVEEQKPDIVLMDVYLPRMGGVAATALITAGVPGVHVLGISSQPSDHIRRAMMDAGAAGYLDKACSVGELYEALREAMKSPAP